MALFGKKKGLVGVDIGSSAIKVVELKPGGKGGAEYQLVNLGLEPLPPEAIVDGAIMDSGAVIDAIQRVFSAQKIKTTEVATSVSGNAVIVKKISLPQMTPEELQESIHWEAEQYIPFDIQDVSIDYKVIEGSGSGGNMDVLLVAVKKDKISDSTSVLSQAGKSGQIVDVDVFALQNCYEVNYGSDPGRVIALLNVGASITNVNIVRGGTSIFNRDIAVGGNQYTDAIQKELNLSFDQAEALKRGGRMDGASADSLHPILNAVSENIALEIQKTFDFFKATSSEDRIDAIFLSGGTARVHGLRELLADRFDAGVELLKPFNNIACHPRDFDPDFIAEIGASAAIAVGLATRKLGDGHINLLAAERTTQKKKPAAAGAPGALQAGLVVGGLVGLTLLGCAAAWWLMSSSLTQLDTDIKTATARQAELQVIKARVEEAERKKKLLDDKVNLIERLKAQQSEPVHLVDEISKSLPDSVWLTAMEQAGGAIKIVGETNSLKSVADFISNLQRSGWFPRVDLVESSEAERVVKFTLSADFRAATTPAAAGAAAPVANPGTAPASGAAGF